jgi:hypothetical protein
MPEKRKSIIVTVTDDALNDIYQVANQLAAEGMEVDRVMPVTGVIAGSSPSTKMADLKNVDGVMSVEEEATAELRGF